MNGDNFLDFIRGNLSELLSSNGSTHCSTIGMDNCSIFRKLHLPLADIFF